ncbi:ABC transporter permease [Chelatococcus asaccharovorans]|uniref:Putative spermidine/putrescine transport system permease protein n=1 Tax=Chelatococcus asaccharovorans TaxID=28210 RepID=A0A2V3U3K8_9HYPH|nr:ABC transporter permease [Chelatococcus asaccharovorans]MBS7702789.1 ABC transporter permease [Chelatococcus asaccharovorans]PXW57081.1 putative spermidine/putrescine transport system permease protein [Chelatococcus asaccharovorans]CAH1672848.1 putative spermidine/putrescine transport system permease protein [Chelatococcus asaccharovorans]CAH1675760.1 putative spermidine/putrescine transport system permease protein [Chelatococcus asaccharovorans]
MDERFSGPGAWILYAITIAMMIFILSPLLLVMAVSVSDSYFVTFPPEGFTLKWYAKVLQDRDFIDAMQLSILLALGATIGSLLLGVPAAFALVRGDFFGAAAITGFLLSPLIFPALVTGLALLQVLSRLGSEDARLNLLIGHIVVTAPYVIRTVLSSLLLVDENLEDAARTLGASRMRTFWRVTLPQIASGVAAGGLFAFMVSFDNYPISMWLANSEYSPVPLVLMRQLVNVFDPSVPAMSTIIILFAMAGVLVLERLVGLRRALTV